MRQLKEVITQKITKMFDEKSTVVDIPKFQNFLVEEFEKKSILTSYKSDNVPIPKKGIAVNGAAIEKGKGKGKGDKGDKGDTPEDPENIKKFKAEYQKEKIRAEADKANIKLLKEKATQLANDPKNAELEVINHPDIKSFMKEKKIKRGCWCCFMHNCFLRQITSRKYNLKKRYLGECKGTLLKLKNLNESPIISEATVEHCTASISPSQQFGENSNEELDRLLNGMDEQEEIYDIDFQQNIVGISTHSTFTKDMIPDSEEMLDTRYVSDKNCVLCNKKNMNYMGLYHHFENSHNLSWGCEEDDSTFEEWVEAFN